MSIYTFRTDLGMWVHTWDGTRYPVGWKPPYDFTSVTLVSGRVVWVPVKGTIAGWVIPDGTDHPPEPSVRLAALAHIRRNPYPNDGDPISVGMGWEEAVLTFHADNSPWVTEGVIGDTLHKACYAVKPKRGMTFVNELVPALCPHQRDTLSPELAQVIWYLLGYHGYSSVPVKLKQIASKATDLVRCNIRSRVPTTFRIWSGQVHDQYAGLGVGTRIHLP